MIDNITTGSPYLLAGGYNASTYVNNYSGAQGVGNLRWNTSSQKMEVYDGTNWITLNQSNATISLTVEATNILNWARDKMMEEQELENMSKEHPTIKDLVNQIKDKKDQIKMVQTLLKSPGHESEQPVPMTSP